jgi:hypothetical protein
MHANKSTNAQQLAKRIFSALKEDDIEEFETKFKHAYGVAIAQCHLSAPQAGQLFSQAKQLSKTLLEEHARKATKNHLPNYFKFRRPVPLFDSEQFTAG